MDSHLAWCFQDWFYLLDSCWNIQPSSNHDPANSEDHNKKSQEHPPKIQSFTDSGHEGMKLCEVLTKVSESFCIKWQFTWLPLQNKKQINMRKEPSLLLGMDTGEPEWGRTTCEKISYRIRSQFCVMTLQIGMSLLSLLVRCRFRCRSLTLTFQGMSSRLAESLKILKMFPSHHEDGNASWNQT